MKPVWWWGNRHWRSSPTWKKQTTANLRCDIYSVSFETQNLTHRKITLLLLTIWLYLLLALSSCSDGLNGTGKTMSLCHTVHFCYTQGWLVLHIPDGETCNKGLTDNHKELQQVSKRIFHMFYFYYTAHLWVKNCKELLPSSYTNSRFDQPLQATEWLRDFRITNEQFLSKVTIYSVPLCMSITIWVYIIKLRLVEYYNVCQNTKKQVCINRP